MVFLLLFIIKLGVVCEAESFDITIVTDITSEELKEYSPEWCKQYCELIVDLSNEYGISSEFAISVFKYEYVPERNSVGGWKSNDNSYNTYDNITESIKYWFENMSETYCNKNSWHYQQTKGTKIVDIAPLYNQGITEYNDKSTKWKDTIESEVKKIIEQ